MFKPTARLISLTEPSHHLFAQGITSAEELIVYCARVSNPDNQYNKEGQEKLLKFLIRNSHWSPFEMVTAQIEIKTTRDISRQILRHRSFSFQEYSQRYAESSALIMREARLQDKGNRQNSLEFDDEAIKSAWNMAQKDINSLAYSKYHAMLSVGVAKEVARALLPEGLTPTTLIMSGTIRSWIHYINERIKICTQKEHRQVAAGCLNVLREDFPVIFSDEVMNAKK